MNLPRKLSQQEIDANRLLQDFTAALKNGKPVSEAERVTAFRHFIEAGNLCTTEPLLPLLLNLKGKPYDLEDHFPFSPFFRTTLPEETVFITARQVGKSSAQASTGIVISNSVPHLSTLYITPLYEQARRFSSNYVGEFIDQSPVKRLWSDTTTNNNVTQRSFKNSSKMIFSFALLDANRTRGVQADVISYDETQDLDRDHIPIINECLSHSDWSLVRHTGTPRSLDNPLETHWQRSSQAQWVVPCYACGKENIPSNEYDLADMIGPWHKGVSAACPGTICARCKKPVDPRYGRWLHKHPDRRWTCVGYHVPQIIMPHHYAREKEWRKLVTKREFMAPDVFNNEVLGESYDSGSKLVNETDLKAAAMLPWVNRPHDPAPEMLARLEHYPMRVLGIDWGGGGKEGVSYTTLALLGWRSDGVIDCLWGRRLLTPHDHIREAKEIRACVSKFQPHFLAHDYTGAGTIRETVLVQSGVPIGRIMPCAYVRSASHNVLNFVPATVTHPRDHYQVDKTRSLLYTTNVLKLGRLRFFAYDYQNDEATGLMRDFLALIDEKSETAAGIYMIKRQEGFSDDFAHAVNLGCVALWHANNQWPDFAHMLGFASISREQLVAAVGPSEEDQEMMGGYFARP